MMHLRGLVLFLLFLLGGARRSIRIDSSHQILQQQKNKLGNRLEVSTEVSTETREALIPGGFRTRIHRRAGPQAGAVREDSKQGGRRGGQLQSHRAELEMIAGAIEAGMPSEKTLSELVEESEELKAARAKFEKEDAEYLGKYPAMKEGDKVLEKLDREAAEDARLKSSAAAKQEEGDKSFEKLDKDAAEEKGLKSSAVAKKEEVGGQEAGMPSEKTLSELVEESEELKAARAKFEKEDAEYLGKYPSMTEGDKVLEKLDRDAAEDARLKSSAAAKQEEGRAAEPVMSAVTERDEDGNPVTQTEMFDAKWVILVLAVFGAVLAKSADVF